MKQLEVIMGMPILVEIIDEDVKKEIFTKVFNYFKYIDAKFSTYKNTSEISLFNQKRIKYSDFSTDMKSIFKLAKKTKTETRGYFNIFNRNYCDPSGIVKGWAIFNAAKIIKQSGYKNFYIDCGGDIQTSGTKNGKAWIVGIKNPFDQSKIVKILSVYNKGIATSGNYIRGNHIYNPKTQNELSDDVVSMTIIAKNVLDADRYATAAFAMGTKGIKFIEELSSCEGYMITKDKMAISTSGFEKYVKKNN